MYKVLPKEKQTAYQRWEIASFEEDVPEKKAPLKTADEIDFAENQDRSLPQVNGQEAKVESATVEDMHALLDGMRKEAQEAGYRSGLEEGLVKGTAEGEKRGYEEGLKRGLEEGLVKGTAEGFEKGFADGRAQGEEYALTLKALAEVFSADVARANEAVTDDLLSLALDMAKAMLKTALNVKPELLVPVVADAVRYLPSLQQPAMLYLNPQDVVIVRRVMGEELASAGWRLVEEDVPRGSCRIDTASNQIDATLETRWKRLAASLGKIQDWME